MEVKFPVFVREKDSGEVTQYASVSEMQRQFEEIDVENNEYEAWDAQGIRLVLIVQPPIWLRIEPSNTATRQNELADAIRTYAETEEVQVDFSGLNRNEFTAVLDRVRNAIRSKARSKTWWRRFKARF